MADFYELLGVSRNASADEIKRAYRQKAMELHPDTNPDAGAAEEFKALSRAYQVLSDPDQRARYDRFGEAGVSGTAVAADRRWTTSSQAASTTCSARCSGAVADSAAVADAGPPGRRAAKTWKSWPR